jgi:hypothetical protein
VCRIASREVSVSFGGENLGDVDGWMTSVAGWGRQVKGEDVLMP